MRRKITITTGLFCTLIFCRLSQGATPTQADLDATFQKTVQPFVTTYCTGCHSGDKPEAGFDLSAYTSLDKVSKDEKRWAGVMNRLKAGEMPPADADLHPSAKDRQVIIDWITQFRSFEAHKYAGDPGVVLARRLSNAEYNYTIRDLTGVDMQPTKEFPIDPANQAGFDTSGESLTMSPGLLKKYMDAAQFVAAHLVLKPDGIDFAPYTVMAETDRDKYCVDEIVNFYKQHPVDLAMYFLAAWEYENRAKLGKPEAGFEDFAAAEQVAPKYLSLVIATLEHPEEVGPIAGLEAMWHNLPIPDAAGRAEALRGCQEMRDLVVTLRAKVRPVIANLQAPRGLQAGSQPLVIWKDRQIANTRYDYIPGTAEQLAPEDLFPDTLAGPMLVLPTDWGPLRTYDDAFQRFCQVFPDTFVVTERAVVYIDPNSQEAKQPGRFLSAGLHSQSGYFRDDQPLCEWILTPEQNHQLDMLWKELDFFSDAYIKEYGGMMWFERSDSTFMKSAEFDFMRPENKDSTSNENIIKLRDLWLVKAKAAGATPMAMDAIAYHFNDMNKTARWVEQARIAAEPIHVQKLVEFAERAYRRPLQQNEKDEIVSFYQSLRNEDQLDHETAIRETLVSILMSPYFSYRVNVAPPADQVASLLDYELANRMSYFLWSSMPDQELLAHAAAGDLHDPKTLLAQTQRMIQDDRVSGLATEFGGNWLDFRQFEETNTVDRDRFPDFTNDLREAMFQEPIHFFMDVAQRDSSVLDFLSGNYTFVNPVLAQHYGMPVSKTTAADQWVRIDNADQYHRGGLLPMAVFQTKNAPGLRTSPVKRGYWVVKRLLGEEIPPPPPNVPALPPDESKLNGLTLPELLATHRQNASCAACHDHFDSIGLAFEGFGPTGEVRTTDMGGNPVENHVTFRDGSEGTGLDGLKNYLLNRRKGDFVDNLCRKLLAKALDRTLILSDDPLIEEMVAKLEANDYRFSVLVDTIISSPQFLNKKG